MKKVLYYLIIMLAFTLNACDNEMDNMQGGDKEILTSSSEIVIKDGKITYPKWLVNVVLSPTPCQGNRLSIPLGLYYSRRWKRTHSRFDGVNSCASCGNYYSCFPENESEKFQ